MKTKNTKTQNKKEGQKEIFYYIIYKYNEVKNDIEYLVSKKDILESINYINDLLLKDYSKKIDIDKKKYNIIKDIEKIVKNNHINRYITLDIENIKLINNYIIFKQYINKDINKKSILDKLEKDALKNDKIEVNYITKKESIHYTFNAKKRIIKAKKWKDKNYKLDKLDAFKKYMEIKQKINNNFNRLHENKNIIIGGGVYE